RRRSLAGRRRARGHRPAGDGQRRRATPARPRRACRPRTPLHRPHHGQRKRSVAEDRSDQLRAGRSNSMSTTALTAPIRASTRVAHTRPGFVRLVAVELRKTVNTRAGFWLQVATVAITALVVT